MRSRFRFASTFISLVFLAACQSGGTSSVSLDQAKRITSDFQGQTAGAPPRSISDITAILDQVSPKFLNLLEADKKTAEGKLSNTLVCTGSDFKPRSAATSAADKRNCGPINRDEDVHDFYLERGLAAGRIGRIQQQLQDLDNAIEHGERSTRSLGITRENRGRAKILSGLFTEGFADISDAQEEVGASRPFGAAYRYIKFQMKTAELSIEVGLVDQANELYYKGSAVFLRRAPGTASKKGPSDEAVPRDWFRSFANHIEALIADRQGQLVEGERLHRASIDLFRNRDNWYTDGTALTWDEIDASLQDYRYALSRNLRRQGRYVEAEGQVRLAMTAALQKFGLLNTHTAKMISGLVENLFDQSRFAEAETLSRRLVRIYKTMGAEDTAFVVARAKTLLADSLAQQDNWSAALTLYEQVRRDMTADKIAFDTFLRGNLNWAIALIKVGRAKDAQEVLSAAAEKKQKILGSKHYETAEVSGLIAVAKTALGDMKPALAQFRHAIPILLSSSRQSEDENTLKAARDLRLGLIMDGYIALLAEVRGTPLEVGIDAASEAFRIADMARSRGVQRAVTAAGARAAANNKDLADLIRREQDTRKQIAARFGRLANILASPPDQQDANVIAKLRSDTDQLRAARAAIAEDIQGRFPQYADLLNPQPATIAKVRSILRSGEALLSTYVVDDKTYVWAVPKSGPVKFHLAPLGRNQLQATVTELRQALDPAAVTLGDIPPFNISLAHRLYSALLEPVKTGWQGADSLLIVAHGPLGQLPLSVLVTKPVPPAAEKSFLFANYQSIPWLARSHAVTVLPSVTSLASLRSLPKPRPGRRVFAGFGDPFFSAVQAAEDKRPNPTQTASLASRGILSIRGLPIRLRSAPKTQKLDSAELAKLPRLPDTADEVRSIALALNADLTTDVFTGSKATEDAVKKTDLSGYKVITFATHGLVPGDLNGLRQPALALTSPQVSGHTDDDGLLTMGEILSLRLDADWVVLSACNTGAANGAGAEAFSGLGRAFFYAGTRAVLLSNWPVETTSARLLTTDLFKRQADDPTLTRAQALRRSMLSLIDGPGFTDQQSGKALFSYAHPIFWAPFSLVGDGGA